MAWERDDTMTSRKILTNSLSSYLLLQLCAWYSEPEYTGSKAQCCQTIYVLIRMEVACSRPNHLPTLSAAKTYKLFLLVKSPFGGGAADAGNATPTFCFSVLTISKLTTLTVELLWTAPTETVKHHFLVIDEAS